MLSLICRILKNVLKSYEENDSKKRRPKKKKEKQMNLLIKQKQTHGLQKQT